MPVPFRHRLQFLFPLLFSLTFFPPASGTLLWAQDVPQYTPQELAEAAQILRSHYYDRAWELATIQGEEWNEGAPDALELRAWYALNLARNGSTEESMEVSEDLMERAPDHPWSWFAYAGSLFRNRERSDEAMEASKKALSLKPADLDFLSLRADVIRVQMGEEEAIAFIDALSPEHRDDPLLQIRKAVALENLASESEDPAKVDEAYDFFREVMELDTTFLEPPFFLGTRLQGARRLDEALPLLQKSAALSPGYAVHEFYWRGIQARRDVTPEEKLALVEAAIEEFFDMGGKTPSALLAVSRVYEGAMQNEKRDSLWAQILSEDPESHAAEWVMVNRYREMQRTLREQQRETGEEDPALRARYRRALEEFLMRPVHRRETLRGDAFRNLLFLLDGDDEVDPEFLYSVVRGVELYEGINTHIIYGRAPITLASHNSHLDYAERLALKGIVEAEKQIEEYRERGIFKTEEELQDASNRSKATMLDALGWVYLAQGRIDDAEGELLTAYQLFEANPTTLLHLGKLYERRHALSLEGEEAESGNEAFLDQAQNFYLKGSLAPSMGDNPNDAALKELYTSRHGDLEGFEAFLASASDTDADTRKDRILAERLEEPKALTAFQMETLAGGTISSEELAGKIVVINFWGTWCGPCVIEMPEIQKFYDQYKDDGSVVFLTLNNDANVDVVHRFMEKEGYTFPVLLDEGFVSEVKVRAFPTTWFVDPEGMICFEKKGWSEELAQEFAWRVEALRPRG